MKKQLPILILVVVGVMALISVLTKNIPLTFGSSGSLPKFDVEDLIKRADLIIVGEVKTNLPSQWIGKNDPQDASSEEVIDARGLFTDSLVSINKVLKGDNLTPVVRVRSFTGETRNIRWISDSEPRYTPHKTYLLFLIKDYGPTANINPGDYIAVGAIQGVFEIVGEKAISVHEEWLLEDLLAYIQKVLSEPAETPVSTVTPETIATEVITDTPSEDITPTP